MPLTEVMLTMRPQRARHRASEVLGPMEAAREIGGDDVVPIRFAHAEQQAVARDAGVVDEDVDHREFLEQFLGGLGDGGTIGDIDREGLGFATGGDDGRGRGAAGIGGFGDADNGDSVLGEAFGDGFADAAARAGDQCCAISKRQAHEGKECEGKCASAQVFQPKLSRPLRPLNRRHAGSVCLS